MARISLDLFELVEVWALESNGDRSRPWPHLDAPAGNGGRPVPALLAGGSGRLHVGRPKSGRGRSSTWALRPSRPCWPSGSRRRSCAPGSAFFEPSAGQISQGIKVATQVAGLGEAFSAHSPRVGMARDLDVA